MKVRSHKYLPNFALISIIIATLMVFPLGCEEKPREQMPFNIAIASWVGFAPFYIAVDKGFFNEEGLNAKVLKIEDQGARRSAFNSGQIQGMVDTLDSFANGVPQGLQGTMILKIDDSYGGDGIVVRKEIDSIKDLRGKTIAYTQGLPPQFFLLYLLKQEGLTSKDIKSLYMDAGDAGAAFVAGKVDAAVTWEPWLSKAKETKHGKILFTSKEYPGLITDIFIINNNVLKSGKGDVEKVLRAWFKAITYISEHPDDAGAIMAQHLGLSAEEVLGMLQGLRFASYEDNLTYFGVHEKMNKFVETFNAASEIWKEEGLITKTVDGASVYDASFLINLYKK
jgi:NitT/TauT family transport system substrate-binding protein